MTCFSCGTQILDGSTVCPRCQGVQPDHSATNRVTQSTPEGVTPIYAYHAPPSFLSPSSSPPAPFKKNRLRTILVAGGSATVLRLALMDFWLYTVETMLHHLSAHPSLTSGAPRTLNPYTRQQELLVIRDLLHDNAVGDTYGYHWMDDVHDGGPGSAATRGCYFADHMYHVSTSDQSSSHTEVCCLTTGSSFSNFTYQVKMSVQQGHLGGIIFRQSPHAHFYAFLMSGTGNYLLFSSSSTDAKLLARGTSASINQRPGVANLFAVFAHGSKLGLFINQHRVASVTDATYSAGLIGTITLSDDGSHRTDIAFADASIWVPSP